MSFEILVTSVAATWAGVDPANLDEVERESTRLALYHSHLPKLVDRGVVEFNREAEAVAPGPRLEIVAARLAAVKELDAC